MAEYKIISTPKSLSCMYKCFLFNK